MPRETISIPTFDGGIANDPHKRDLKVGESVVIKNLDLRSGGILKTLGIFYPDTSVSWSFLIDTVDDYLPGYGAYFFSADRNPSGDAAETDYYVLAGRAGILGAADKPYQIFTNSTNLQTTGGQSYDTVNIAGDSNTFYPAFYYADGALRVTDGNHNSSKVKTRWVGFIDRSHFSGTTAVETYSGWYFRDQEIAPPTRGIAYPAVYATAASDTNTFVVDTATTQYSHWAFDLYSTEIIGHHLFDIDDCRRILTWNSSSSFETQELSTGWSTGPFRLIAPPAGGVNLNVIAYSSTAGGSLGNGSLPEGEYYFASSFVYDDGQESPLYKMKGRLEISTATAGLAPYSIQIFPSFTKPYNPRISQTNIYYGRKDTEVFGGLNDTEISVRDWIQLTQIDMDDGVRLNPGWNYHSVATTGGVSSDIFISGKYTLFLSDGNDLYESVSNRSSTEVESKITFKTAVLANRRAYLGNVKFNGKVYGDSIFKSAVNKFDTFSPLSRLEVIAADGDSIIRLEEYADRILAFKRKKVYIINVSQDVEFIEEQLDVIGVTRPHHVTRTEYGVIWINRYGAYLYDGREVRDLLIDPREPGRTKISKESWSEFFTDGSVAIYEPIEKLFFVTNDSESSAVPPTLSCKCLSLMEGSWVDADSIIKSDDDLAIPVLEITNPVYNNDGNGLIFRSATTVAKGVRYQLKSPPSASYETAEFDLGEPGTDKHFYVAYITHKGTSANGVRVRYRINGTSAVYAMDPEYLPASSSYVTTRMVPASSSNGRNLDSISILLDVTEPSTSLEVGSIDLIVRKKGLR